MKMKLILLLVLSSFFSLANAQYIHPEVLSNAEKFPNRLQNVYIVLRSFPDMEKMRYELKQSRMSPNARASFVREELMDIASAEQPLVVEKLKAKSDKVDLNSVKPLWVCNCIYAKVQNSFLNEISQWPEVEGIYPEIKAETQHEVSNQIAEFIPNGTEPGLRAIGAPAMWAKGYTGYGTKAVVFDSGEDWNHPAIKEQFYGLYVPLENAWSAPGSVPFDVGGHGTHVTGTICGIDRLRNDTIGVAFNAMWIGAPVQFGNSPPQPLPVLDFLENMQYSIDPNGNGTDLPDVINNSWSGGGYTDCSGNSAFARTISTAENSGIAVVWAAGNQGPDFSTVRGYQNNNYELLTGFSVGATSPYSPYVIADFSSRGPSTCGKAGALAIKPEVSAPGVGIRSCVLNGNYSAFNGTSMASPHVAGAVLLLKEAFPYLVGEDILYALYMTAIDLGAPGEDNEYGRGFISLPAAFDYLVNEGNVPVPASIPERDALVVGIEKDFSRACNKSISANLNVENAGTDIINSLDIIVKVSVGQVNCVQQIRWEGELPQNGRFNIPLDILNCPQFISDSYFNPGVYEIELEIIEINGQADQRPLNNRTRMEIKINSDRPMTVHTEGLDEAVACKNTSIVLHADYDGYGVIEWYNSPNSVTPIHEGPTFQTPVIGKRITYYPKPILKNIGMKRYDEGQFSNEEPEEGSTLYFDVYEYLKFESVVVHSTRQGIFVCELCEPNGHCQQITKVIRPGENVININMSLYPGENWSLVKTSTNITPYYSTTGVGFPYVYDKLLTIYGSDHPQNAYMYFYDWRLSYSNPCPIEPVRVEMLPVLHSPILKIDVPDTIYISEENLFEPNLIIEHSDQWLFEFGDGMVSELSHPFHKYEKAGNYMLKLSARSNEGCMHSVTKSLTVLDNTILGSNDLTLNDMNFKLYPNPGKEIVFLEYFGEQLDLPVKVQVLDILGRSLMQQTSVWSSGSTLTLDMKGLSEGAYQISITAGHQNTSFKWLKN
jgi:hypothetical protein